MYSQLENLTELQTLLTEDNVLRVLQARFYAGKYHIHIGPVLVSVNPLSASPMPRALTGLGRAPCHLVGAVNKAVNQLRESGVSQTILLSGMSGSGKSHSCVLLLRELFQAVGGGTETDSFKQLDAALTVLRVMSTAGTVNNRNSSRMGQFIENQVIDGAISRTKIHCYFLDQGRVTRRQANESNFKIFYYMLSGLTEEEKKTYHLSPYDPMSIRYVCDTEKTQDNLNQELTDSKIYFEEWKSCLAILGVPLTDIMRVLSAILLLGNIRFTEGTTFDLRTKGEQEMKSVAALLGMSSVTLYQGLTTVSRTARRKLFKTGANAFTANQRKESLARALYARTVLALVKRVNSSRRPRDHYDNSVRTASGRESSQSTQLPQVGLPLSRNSSFTQIEKGGSPQNSAFIGILDMFGFEILKNNCLEQLCINLCSETLQHFYNSHVFKTTEEACIDEGIQSDMDVHYVENAQIVELLSSQRTGILSILETECRLQKGSVEAYMQKVRVQHKFNKYFSECPSSPGKEKFAIQHFAGRVEYDVNDFVHANRNQLSDDIIWMFDRSNCNFGFVSHLFSLEIRAIQENGGKPQGYHYSLVHGTSNDINSGQHSLSGDFHTKLDSLLKALIHSKPSFIRCLKSNSSGQRDLFNRETVVKQIRSYQILETLHLMAEGFPHRVKYKVFNVRYRCLTKTHSGKSEDRSYTESKVILDRFLKTLEVEEGLSVISDVQWALGKKHIFLTECAYQQLERLRGSKRHKAAHTIQSAWRRYCREIRWPSLHRRRTLHNPCPERPRHRRCISEGDALSWVKSNSGDKDVFQHTLGVYGLDMDNPPALPSKRTYTVKGNIRLGYPQLRVMKQAYSDMTSPSTDVVLQKGEEICVTGASSKPGYLLVDYHSNKIHVPYQLTELKASSSENANGVKTYSSLLNPHEQKAQSGYQVDV